MGRGVFRYDKMVETALRGVLREALGVTAKEGLPGEHHFYITFRTRHPEVVIPDYIRARYPDEMTIVLQHHFWGLEVTDEWFEVTLSFNRMNERLHVPFAAVSAFADPSAKFGLQFQVDTSVEAAIPAEAAATPGGTAVTAPKPPEPEAPEEGARVITLDAFRKK